MADSKYTNPEFPVVDSDSGDGDVYGRARTEAEAIAVADQCFADPVKSAYFSEGPIALRDGSVIDSAWVALTDSGLENRASGQAA